MFIDHSGLNPLKQVWHQQRGTFILCSPEGTGKTSSILETAFKLKDHAQLLRLSCSNIDDPLSIDWMHKNYLGETDPLWQASVPAPDECANLWRDIFKVFPPPKQLFASRMIGRNNRVILCIEDFDRAMQLHRTQSLQFISDLHRESMNSTNFLILVECKDHLIAHAILDHMRGQAYWIPLEWPKEATQEFMTHARVHPYHHDLASAFLESTGDIRRLRRRLDTGFKYVTPAEQLYDKLDARKFARYRDTLGIFEFPVK